MLTADFYYQNKEEKAVMQYETLFYLRALFPMQKITSSVARALQIMDKIIFGEKNGEKGDAVYFSPAFFMEGFF